MSRVSTKKYHPFHVTLHWQVALLVIAAFVVGKTMSGLPNDADKLAPLGLHMSIGIFTLVVIIVRIGTRMKLPKPGPATTGNPLLDWVGRVVHYALYLFVIMMAVSGTSLAMQAGLVPIVFGGSEMALPADFYDFAARMLHGFIVPVLLLLVLLHVGAAFYHQFALKDNLLARMWYGKHKETE